MAGAEQGGQAAADARLDHLKEESVVGAHAARRTPFTVLSGLLVLAAGVLLIVGAALPWLSIAGESVAAVREGGPDGAAATFCMAVGAAWVLLGALSAVGRRSGPRFVHWLTLPLALLVLILVRYRADILGNTVFVHNADIHDEGAARIEAGITVVYAALALGVAAPLLSVRQALRVLRT